MSGIFQGEDETSRLRGGAEVGEQLPPCEDVLGRQNAAEIPDGCRDWCLSGWTRALGVVSSGLDCSRGQLWHEAVLCGVPVGGAQSWAGLLRVGFSRSRGPGVPLNYNQLRRRGEKWFLAGSPKMPGIPDLG